MRNSRPTDGTRIAARRPARLSRKLSWRAGATAGGSRTTTAIISPDTATTPAAATNVARQPIAATA
jgi:hypothetical protein